MTIYFAGTEDSSFTPGGTGFTVTTNANAFRSAFSRCGIAPAAGGTGFPPSSYAASTSFSASSFWVHGRYSNFVVGSNATTNGDALLYLVDSGSIGRLLLQATGVAGQLQIVKRNAAGTLTVLATTSPGRFPFTVAGQPSAVDLFVNYSTTGQATLYIDGTVAADTGPSVDITTDGATTLCQAWFGTYLNNQNTVWTETICQDTTTLGANLFTQPPIAAGNTQSWTPNTVGNVNPITTNDANFVATTSANQLSEWTLATTLPPGAWMIAAVTQSARVSAGATGPQHFEWLVRTSDGSDHVTGSVAPAVGSFGNFFNSWPQNPHTSAAWGAGELINSGIESLT